MTYIDSILEPGEQVRYRTTVSWTSYTPAILLAICALERFPIRLHRIQRRRNSFGIRRG